MGKVARMVPVSKDEPDFDALVDSLQSKKGPDCHACNLPPDIKEKVERAVKNGKQYSSIAAALRQLKHPIEDYNLSRHFRKRHHVR